MEFRVTQKPKNGYFTLYIPECPKFKGIKAPIDGIGEHIIHDICAMCNDKYIDKEINKEWPEINRKERIKYHLEQLQKLTSDDRLYWNEHGTGVKNLND